MEDDNKLQPIPAHDFIKSEIKKFETVHEITEESLFALVEKFKDLKVDGVNDKEGLKKVDEGRKILKKERSKIVNIAKGMRASATAFSKAVIEKERELVALIEPTEDKLSEIADSIWEEKERLREEEEKRESDRIQAMIDKLNAVNYAVDFHELKGLTDEQFEETLKSATEAFEEKSRLAEKEKEEERERIRLSELERKQEEERLVKEREEQAERQRKFEEEQAAFRAEQDRVRREQEEREAEIRKEQDRINAEKKALQEKMVAEERERQRQAELEKAREEAAEKARIEAEAKAKREEEERIAAERKAKEEEEERILSGDDKGRFAKLISMLDSAFLSEDVIIWTHFKSKRGKVAANRVHELLKQARQICSENR